MKRLEYLDSVRGLAALSVLFSHFFLAYDIYKINWLQYSPMHIFYDGFAAVCFFFVLSGFVLTVGFFSERKEILLGQYFVGRIFRIYVPYAVVLIFSIVLCNTIWVFLPVDPLQNSWISAFWRTGLTFDNIVDQLVFRLPSAPVYVPQNWTLGLELAISALVPVLAYLLRERMGLFILLGAALSLVLSYFVFHFMLGILIAYYSGAIRGFYRKLSRRSKILLVLVALFLYTFRYTLPAYVVHFFQLGGNSQLVAALDVVDYLVPGVGASLLLVGVLNSGLLQKIFSTPALRWIGRISYSIYLCHMIVLIVVLPPASVWMQQVLKLDPATTVFAGFFVAVLGTLALSTFLYQSVERPSISAGRWLARTFSRG